MKFFLAATLSLTGAVVVSADAATTTSHGRELGNYLQTNTLFSNVQFSSCMTLKTADEDNGEDTYEVSYGVENYVVINKGGSSSNENLYMMPLKSFVEATLAEMMYEDEKVCEACNEWGQLSYDYCVLGVMNEDEWQGEQAYEEQQGQYSAYSGSSSNNAFTITCDMCAQSDCWDYNENEYQQMYGVEGAQETPSVRETLEWLEELGECMETEYYTESGYQLFVGWMCNGESTGMELASFIDEDCTQYFPGLSGYDALNNVVQNYDNEDGNEQGGGEEEYNAQYSEPSLYLKSTQKIMSSFVSSSHSCSERTGYYLPDGKYVYEREYGQQNVNTLCQQVYGVTGQGQNQGNGGNYGNGDFNPTAMRIDTCMPDDAQYNEEWMSAMNMMNFTTYQQGVNAGQFGSYTNYGSYSQYMKELMLQRQEQYQQYQQNNGGGDGEGDEGEQQWAREIEACRYIQYMSQNDMNSLIGYNPYYDPWYNNQFQYNDPAYESDYSWNKASNFNHGSYNHYEKPVQSDALLSRATAVGKLVALACGVFFFLVLLLVGSYKLFVQPSPNKEDGSPRITENDVPQRLAPVVKAISRVSSVASQKVRKAMEATVIEDEDLDRPLEAAAEEDGSPRITEKDDVPQRLAPVVKSISSVSSVATQKAKILVDGDLDAKGVVDEDLDRSLEAGADSTSSAAPDGFHDEYDPASYVKVGDSGKVEAPNGSALKKGQKKSYKRPLLAKLSKRVFGRG